MKQRMTTRIADTSGKRSAADAACIVCQAFDSEIFGVPYYRIVRFDERRLARELPPVLRQPAVIVDAKLPGNRHELARWLQTLGFRIVCTQITLLHDLAAIPPVPPEVRIDSKLALDDATLAAHAANFSTDRFSLDPLISRERHDALYLKWISNSLAGRMSVASVGRNFCTFRSTDDVTTIDLLSVLDKRQGVGRKLISAVLASARPGRHVRVVTECSNEAAWRLYLKCGFAVDGFIECLHFVAA